MFHHCSYVCLAVQVLFTISAVRWIAGRVFKGLAPRAPRPDSALTQRATEEEVRQRRRAPDTAGE